MSVFLLEGEEGGLVLVLDFVEGALEVAVAFF